jgi:hypothetical protein
MTAWADAVLTREPGDLAIDRSAEAAGPHRDDGAREYNLSANLLSPISNIRAVTRQPAQIGLEHVEERALKLGKRRAVLRFVNPRLDLFRIPIARRVTPDGVVAAHNSRHAQSSFD